MRSDLYLTDCIEYMKTLPDNSVQHILTDPPYMYLEHELDVPFNEYEFFSQCYRIMKEGCFLVFFCSSESANEWATMVGRSTERFSHVMYNGELVPRIGFKYKERLVWDKGALSSPTARLGRQHELAFVFCKGQTPLNVVRIDAFAKIEDRNMTRLYAKDLRSLIKAIDEIKSYEELELWRSGQIKLDRVKNKHNITCENLKYSIDRNSKIYTKYHKGALLSDVINVPREHRKFEHGTQKPVRLLQYLIQLISNENDLIFDPFMGSGSTGIAAFNLNRHFIGCELNPKFFKIAENRILRESATVQSML